MSFSPFPPGSPLRHVWLFSLLIGANLLWGSAWVVAKLTLTELTPLQVSAWRMIGAGVLVAPWLIWRWKREPLPPRAWPALIALGAVGFVVSKFLNFWGLNLTTATNASLLMATEPLLTIALGWLVLREALGGRRLAAFALGAAGAYLLITGGAGWPDLSSAHVLGDLVFLLGLGGEAVYSVFGKSLLTRHSASTVTMATIAASLLFWLPLAGVDGALSGWPTWNAATVGALLWLSIGCTVLAYWAWFHALEEMEAGLAALTIFVQPVWGSLLAYLLLGESFTAVTFAGGALVLGSLYLAVSGGQEASSTPGPRPGTPTTGDSAP